MTCTVELRGVALACRVVVRKLVTCTVELRGVALACRMVVRQEMAGAVELGRRRSASRVGGVALADTVVVVTLVAAVAAVVLRARVLPVAAVYPGVLVVGVTDTPHTGATGSVASTLSVLGHATVTGAVVDGALIGAVTRVVATLLVVRTRCGRLLTGARTVTGAGGTILVLVLAVAHSAANPIVQVAGRHVVAAAPARGRGGLLVRPVVLRVGGRGRVVGLGVSGRVLGLPGIRCGSSNGRGGGVRLGFLPGSAVAVPGICDICVARSGGRSSRVLGGLAVRAVCKGRHRRPNQHDRDDRETNRKGCTTGESCSHELPLPFGRRRLSRSATTAY